MKAIVKYAMDDRAVTVRDVPAPELRSGTVRIATRAVGVCGSDVHAWRDHQSWEMRLPVVLGHETAGVIESIAPDVTGWTVGDRVVCETAASICGRCALCRSGNYNLCPARQGYGALRDGAMAELIVAEPRTLHHIPDGLSFQSAAMTEPFSVAFNALVERATVIPGDLVVVQGVGAIGNLAMQVARLRGAASIVALGAASDGLRLDKARRLAADRTVDITAEDPVSIVAGMGDGLGADLVVDATGVSAALEQSLDLVRPGGMIAKIGWGPQPLNYSLDPLVAKSVTLHGSFSHTWDTWERVLRLFAKDRLDPASVIGNTYGLEDFAEAFSAMEDGRNIKSVILMPEHQQYAPVPR